MRNERRARGWQGGFTLIEMIVVLVVLGLALGLLVSRGPVHSERLEIDATARELVGALRLARGEAIARNAPVAVVISPAAHAYRIGDGPVRRLPATLAVSVAAAGPPPGAVLFASDGSSSGGRIELAGPSRRVLVAVDWLTGRVSAADTR